MQFCISVQQNFEVLTPWSGSYKKKTLLHPEIIISYKLILILFLCKISTPVYSMGVPLHCLYFQWISMCTCIFFFHSVCMAFTIIVCKIIYMFTNSYIYIYINNKKNTCNRIIFVWWNLTWITYEWILVN
jgi:hypothetical protein